MWTIGYKGAFIHGYFDRDECTVIIGSSPVVLRRSLHAAKLYITARAKR